MKFLGLTLAFAAVAHGLSAKQHVRQDNKAVTQKPQEPKSCNSYGYKLVQTPKVNGTLTPAGLHSEIKRLIDSMPALNNKSPCCHSMRILMEDRVNSFAMSAEQYLKECAVAPKHVTQNRKPKRKPKRKLVSRKPVQKTTTKKTTVKATQKPTTTTRKPTTKKITMKKVTMKPTTKATIKVKPTTKKVNMKFKPTTTTQKPKPMKQNGDRKIVVSRNKIRIDPLEKLLDPKHKF